MDNANIKAGYPDKLVITPQKQRMDSPRGVTQTSCKELTNSQGEKNV